MKVITHSAEETKELGQAIGRLAKSSFALLLSGDYGCGKTTFVQGLAKGLEIEGPVRSPSYNILKKYTTGRMVLIHADFYRTQGQVEVEELGIDELAGDNCIIAVEWPGSASLPIDGMPVVRIEYTLLDSEDDGATEQRQIDFFDDESSPPELIEACSAFIAR